MDCKYACLLLVATLCMVVVRISAEEYEPYYGHYYSHQPKHYEEEHLVDYHAHPKYKYDYSVKDPHSGDQKEHWETRDGDKVKGQYSLIDADGTKRIVEYEADNHNGFNAIVHRIGKPKEQPHVHKDWYNHFSQNERGYFQ